MALTSDVARTNYAPGLPVTTYPIKAGQKFFKGSIVTVKAGLAYNGTNSDNTHVAMGIAYCPVDATLATADGKANGGFDVIIEPGTWGDFTSGTTTDTVSFANRPAAVYVIDDDTLGLTDGSTTRCGPINLYEIADDGVSLAVQFLEVR